MAALSYIAASRKRRERVRAATVGTVSRRAVFIRDRGACGICGRPVDPTNWHLDHIVPIGPGLHTMSNVQVSHPRCNLRKYNKRGNPRMTVTLTVVVPGNIATEYLDPKDNGMAALIGLPAADIRPRGRGTQWVYEDVSLPVVFDTGEYLEERGTACATAGKDGAVHRAAVKLAADLFVLARAAELTARNTVADDTVAEELSGVDVEAAVAAAEAAERAAEADAKPKRQRRRIAAPAAAKGGA